MILEKMKRDQAPKRHIRTLVAELQHENFHSRIDNILLAKS